MNSSGEGGDDIMVGGEGEDHFDGGSGFDWGTYKFDRFGVTVDMLVSDLFEPPVAPSNAGILDRFAFTEGLSGSAFGDFLRGDDADAAQIATAGAQGSVLTNFALIDGLQEFARRRRDLVRLRQHHPRRRRQRHHRRPRRRRPDRRRSVAERARQRAGRHRSRNRAADRSGDRQLRQPKPT